MKKPISFAIIILVFFCICTVKESCGHGRYSATFAAAPVFANGGVMMLGDSITASRNMTDLFGVPVINKGVPGFATEDILDNFDNLFLGTPDKVFILLGINDILKSVEEERFLRNYRTIIHEIKSRSPKARIYVLSILPTAVPRYNAEVTGFNLALVKMAFMENVAYVDLYSHFIRGPLVNLRYVTDGIHLNDKGYLIFKEVLTQYF